MYLLLADTILPSHAHITVAVLNDFQAVAMDEDAAMDRLYFYGQTRMINYYVTPVPPFRNSCTG